MQFDAAMAHLKKRDWRKAEDDAGSALAIDASHVKSYHRRSVARASLDLTSYLSLFGSKFSGQKFEFVHPLPSSEGLLSPPRASVLRAKYFREGQKR